MDMLPPEVTAPSINWMSATATFLLLPFEVVAKVRSPLADRRPLTPMTPSAFTAKLPLLAAISPNTRTVPLPLLDWLSILMESAKMPPAGVTLNALARGVFVAAWVEPRTAPTVAL